MIGRIAFAAVVAFIAMTDVARAGSRYDGSWSLTINTARGSCDATYYFAVNIYNGIVSHPNLVKFRGRVSSNGAVRVSVSASGRTAAGSGRLTQSAGSGRWSGSSGSDRCSGTWTAQRM
jgi:hypothetical protein